MRQNLENGVGQVAVSGDIQAGYVTQLIKKMPKIYESQWLGIKSGHTTFLAPVGKDTIFGGVFASEFILRLFQKSDGEVLNWDVIR